MWEAIVDLGTNGDKSLNYPRVVAMEIPKLLRQKN